MKSALFGVVSLACISSGSLFAQANSLKVDEIPSFQLAFENLPKEEKQKYAEMRMKADQFFRQKRIFEALEQINEAKQIFDEDPLLWNLLGSCHVEFRSFAKASEAYRKALSLQPNNRGVQFNLAEMDFVTKKWADSEAKFLKFAEAIEEEHDDLNAPNVMELHRLSHFKRLLCKIKLDDRAGAEQIYEKYSDDLDDSPFTYYSRAAFAFADDDEEKAQEWLASAARVFAKPQLLANWQDTLIEFGYIKSFYGGDEQNFELDLEN